MKIFTTTIRSVKNIFTTRPSNAFLLFLTGFFFTQFMLVNILYIKHPFGGWMTSVGTFTTSSILFTLLFALSLCLIALWRSATKGKNAQESLEIKASIVKLNTHFSPIDYPKGSTQSVVPAYAVG